MKKHRTSDYIKSKRLPFYCKEHSPNTTHNSKDCKVFNGNRKDPNDWMKKDTSNSTDYKAKYKKKIANSISYNSIQERESEVDESLQEAYKIRWA